MRLAMKGAATLLLAAFQRPHSAEPAGRIDHAAAAGATDGRVLALRGIVRTILRLRPAGTLRPVAAGYGRDRRAGDPEAAGDSPLGKRSSGQQPLDFRDKAGAEHRSTPWGGRWPRPHSIDWVAHFQLVF